AIETKQLAERLAVMDFDILKRRTEFFDQSCRPDEESPVVGQILGHRAGREIAFRIPCRHPCPRAESPESESAAASTPPATRERRDPPCRCCRWCSCRRKRRPRQSPLPATYESRGPIRREAPCR